MEELKKVVEGATKGDAQWSPASKKREKRPFDYTSKKKTFQEDDRDDPDHDDGDEGRGEDPVRDAYWDKVVADRDARMRRNPPELGMAGARKRTKKRRAARNPNPPKPDFMRGKKTFQEQRPLGHNRGEAEDMFADNPEAFSQKVSSSKGRAAAVQQAKDTAGAAGVTPSETGIIQDINKLLSAAAAEGRIDQGKVKNVMKVLAVLLKDIAGA